ncbi:GntR family transcriptional regulator [Adlercreutzia sp. ZJ154]|uniref:GntR family transcriptional regulator n=1 Tax=Adlercreutzia sp. ZJ154 TaxID=2709790 RepID=UPI0013ECCAFB|nr:GntR family transcriptional regulator [Adlercreutzia sp. ZJ154]
MISFQIDESSDIPLWVQLRQRIAYLINSGELKPGEKLPTVRGLASDISINYNTVNKAYLSLVSDGYLESTRGRGVFVTDIASKLGDDELDQVNGIMDDAIAACRELGMDYADIEKTFTRYIKRIRFNAEHGGEGSVLGGRIMDFREEKNKRKTRGA